MIDVTVYAESIRRDAVAVLKETGHRRLCLVGWSMGGVAALYAMKRLGLHCLVDSLVAYGSPFQGANLTYPGFLTGLYSRTAVQLMPGSHFLKELHEDSLPEEARIVAIAGSRDLMVRPKQAYLDGADNRSAPYGHGEFLIRPSLHRLIAACLE